MINKKRDGSPLFIICILGVGISIVAYQVNSKLLIVTGFMMVTLTSLYGTLLFIRALRLKRKEHARRKKKGLTL